MREAKQLDVLIFKKSWADTFISMSNENAGVLIKALCKSMQGRPHGLNGIVDAAICIQYERISRQMDSAARKYLALTADIAKDEDPLAF